MTDSGLPPTHRRRWRLWTDPGFAEVEWRELEVLQDELRHASEHIARIGRGMGSLPGAARVSGMASTLTRMRLRWEQRATQAKSDAVKDHGGGVDWVEAQEAKILEEKAVTVMSRALTELEVAERLLGRDSATAERLRKLRGPLDDLYAEIHQRDLKRRLEWEV
jgi:hypothetical protein